MAEPGRHPREVGLIGGNGACERFSFHGMASILVLYMNGHLLYGERDAKAGYHAFVMAASLAPILGGWIAGRFLGRHRSIARASFPYVLGLAVLATWGSRAALVLGLALVAVGAGGIAPCVSALVGDELRDAPATLRRRAHRWLHPVVNVGSAASMLLVPALLAAFGPRAAFALPAALMAAALLVFRSGHVVPQPSGPDPHGFLRVVVHAVSRLGTGQGHPHWLDLARDVHPAEAVDGAKAVFRMTGVFAAVTVFWALFHQKGSSWVFQARQMDLALAGRQLSPAQLQALSPLLLLALLPLLTRAVFPVLERRGTALPPLRKLSAGMFVTAASFAAAALVQGLIDSGRVPHALWQIPQYVLLTAGEVLVSVGALEIGTTRAPSAMRSTITSIWFLTIFLGNLVTVLVTQVVRLEGAAYFWFFAGLMLAAALVFRTIARSGRSEPADVVVAE